MSERKGMFEILLILNAAQPQPAFTDLTNYVPKYVCEEVCGRVHPQSYTF